VTVLLIHHTPDWLVPSVRVVPMNFVCLAVAAVGHGASTAPGPPMPDARKHTENAEALKRNAKDPIILMGEKGNVWTKPRKIRC